VAIIQWKILGKPGYKPKNDVYRFIVVVLLYDLCYTPTTKYRKFSVFYYFFPHFWQLKTSKNGFIFYFLILLFGQNFGDNKKADYTT
jgi:hypothetical protein